MGRMKEFAMEIGHDLFSAAAAADAKKEGMARSEFGADHLWKEKMYAYVVEVASAKHRFTSDDVFELAEARGVNSSTHDLRAFGPVMMRAARSGICKKADCAPINSRRASLHASPRAVWESLVA